MSQYDAWKANVPNDPKELSIKLSCDCGQWNGILEDIYDGSIYLEACCPICHTLVWPGLKIYNQDQLARASELKSED